MDILRANHILPEGTCASEVRFKRSGKYPEAACANGLRIRSSPHRLVFSSPSSNGDDGVDARLRAVLDRYLAAAPEMVCKSIDIKPVAEVTGSNTFSVPLFTQAAAKQSSSVSPALSGFHVMLNGRRLSFDVHMQDLLQDHSRNSTEGAVLLIFSAVFNHELRLPKAACSEIGSVAARSSRRDVELFGKHIGRLIEMEKIERYRNYAFEDVDDLAESALELGLQIPSEATKARAKELLLALFEQHPNCYMAEPAEDGSVSISASAGERHLVDIFAHPDGKASCCLLREGQHSHAEYAATDSLPDEFLLDAVAEQA